MRARTLAALIIAMFVALPSIAQEQRGVIEGLVKDSSGAVLPGATVEVKAPSGATVNTTSDGSGVFRFPSLAPGVYEVTATLQGFSPARVPDVLVAVGQVKKVDVALSVGGLSDSVMVSAESPLVDVRQSARQVNIRAEQVELLPKGRDFTTLVTQAPGANQETKSGGLSIDGASAGENRYIIDGIETTNLQNGTSGKNLIADFVEEVQVKSSGYTAEFGGATGGVISALTKSGTNTWKGSAIFNYEGSNLAGQSRPSLRQNLANSDLAEYITYPKDDTTRIEPGGSLGGPIVANRLWFFGAYLPALTTNDRAVTTSSSGNVNATTADIEQKLQVQYLTGNISTQLSDNLRGRIAYNNSWNRTKGLLPALNGSDPLNVNYGKTSVFPNYTVSGNMDWTVSPRLFFGVRGGYYSSDQHDTNVTEDVRYTWTTTSNIGLLDVPANLQHGTNFASLPSNSKVTRDQKTRGSFQADGTLYGNLAGSHQIKFGVQADRLGNDVLSGEARNLVTIRWNTALSTGVPLTRGTYGYYSVRSNAVHPEQGLITEGNIHSNLIGLFIQDAWTIGSRLTVNAGIRTEREEVPTYSTGAEVPDFGIKFGFGDKFAPRVGAAYDITGDGRTKVFGSWGVFYDIFKLELPRGSFGGDKWLEYYYTLDTPNWPGLVASTACPPACPGTIIRGAPTAANPIGGIDFRAVSLGSDSLEPDLKPMRQQEATAGIEHQIGQRLSASLRYVHKQLDRAVEDTGFLQPDGSEGYVIANPGEGLTQLAFTNPDIALPKPKRDYDSVEAAIEKRFADNWYLRASYLWSRLYGNYTGLSQSDENGRTAPNVGRSYDYPMMMFQDGGQEAFGPLPTDRPNQFKTQFIYQFNFGTSIGVNQYVASGLPISRELGIFPNNNYPVQYEGRGSDGRTPTYSQTDLLVQHSFRFAGTRSFQVSFNVLNLFNQDTVVNRFVTYQKTNGVVPDEKLFYTGQQTLASLITSQNIIKDPRFLMDNGYQIPIAARFGVKFTF